MHIRPKPPTVKNPPEQFTGDVWFDVIASPQDENQRMVVGIVRFAPGARTAWHSHARGQTLHVTQGVAWVQSRGGEKVELAAGRTVYCPPGEEHWHRARLVHGAPGDAGQRRRTGCHHHVARARHRRRLPGLRTDTGRSHRFAANVRMSAASRSGSSIAMKWPPRGRTVQRGR